MLYKKKIAEPMLFLPKKSILLPGILLMTIITAGIFLFRHNFLKTFSLPPAIETPYPPAAGGLTRTQSAPPPVPPAPLSSSFSLVVPATIPDKPQPKKYPDKIFTTVSLADIKTCLAKPIPENSSCLDGLFRAFLKDHTTADALKIVQSYEDTDTQLRYGCHPVVHAIGRETFAAKRTVHDSFAVCDQTCHSGCYHGAMERFLRGDLADNETAHINDEEIAKKITSACPPDQSTRFRFQCLHGLGHAILFSLDYKLESTLGLCDKLSSQWDRSSCWGGAFMENVFASVPAKSDVSQTDYHYPCSKLDEQYKSDCYVMQTTRMSQMGLAVAQLFEECRKAEVYALSCAQSIGRDLSNDARIGNPRPTAEKCEDGTNESEQHACIRGVIYALMDNTWDGRYAFPFCNSFQNASLLSYCMTTSAQYLRATYDKTKETILNDCVLRMDDRAACTDATKEL